MGRQARGRVGHGLSMGAERPECGRGWKVREGWGVDGVGNSHCWAVKMYTIMQTEMLLTILAESVTRARAFIVMRVVDSRSSSKSAMTVDKRNDASRMLFTY